MIIANKEVRRVYVDNGAIVSVIYLSCFEQLGVDLSHLRPCAPLQTSSRNEIQPIGAITLVAMVGDHPR